MTRERISIVDHEANGRSARAEVRRAEGNGVETAAERVAVPPTVERRPAAARPRLQGAPLT